MARVELRSLDQSDPPSPVQIRRITGGWEGLKWRRRSGDWQLSAEGPPGDDELFEDTWPYFPRRF